MNNERPEPSPETRLDRDAVDDPYEDRAIRHLREIRDACEALVTAADNLSYRRSPHEKPAFRDKVTDATIGVAALFAFCLGVGSLGAMLASIVDEIRQNDRKHVRIIYDPKDGKLHSAFVFDTPLEQPTKVETSTTIDPRFARCKCGARAWVPGTPGSPPKGHAVDACTDFP